MEAIEDQLQRAPTGNLNHRIWTGDCLKAMRQDKANDKDLALAQMVDVEGHGASEKGLMARPPLPRVQPLKHDTFHWYIKPAELPMEGDVYPDGSLLDNIAPDWRGTGGRQLL